MPYFLYLTNTNKLQKRKKYNEDSAVQKIVTLLYKNAFKTILN